MLRCKEYGILSVLFQLYTQPKINFKIPPTVFYPQPKVTSALITLDFLHLGPDGMDPLFDVSDADLKEVGEADRQTDQHQSIVRLPYRTTDRQTDRLAAGLTGCLSVHRC